MGFIHHKSNTRPENMRRLSLLFTALLSKKPFD